MSATSPPERPLRADARRNREKIVAAAREAFSATGLATGMDDIAARAGVGVGTLYRHFPTKDALAHALMRQRYEEIAAETQRRVDDVDLDPWEALTGTLRFAAALQARDLGLSHVLAAAPEACHRCREELGVHEKTDVLIQRARAAGVVRPDLSLSDVALFFTGLGRVLEAVALGADLDHERYVELMLDGFRRSFRES